MGGTPPSWNHWKARVGLRVMQLGHNQCRWALDGLRVLGPEGLQGVQVMGSYGIPGCSHYWRLTWRWGLWTPTSTSTKTLWRVSRRMRWTKAMFRGSNKVGEIVKMMSDEEVDQVSHYRDKINVVDCNEMAIKEVMYVEPIKEVRFTWTMGLNKSRCIGVCGIRYNPLDKITELQWDKFMEEVKCKCFGPQNRQCCLKRNLAKCGKTGNEGTKGTWTRSTCRTSWTSSWITSLRSGGNFHTIKLIQNLIVIRSKTFI